MTTYEKVKQLISVQLKAPEDKITPESRLEDQFNIMVEDDMIMKLKTVDDVVKYIDSKA